MKVSVYKHEDGTMSALIQASPGRGKRPVIISDITPGNVKGKVGPAIDKMRGPKTP